MPCLVLGYSVMAQGIAKEKNERKGRMMGNGEGNDFMIDRWIAEATECDFKVALEVKKPKSWLKSVSAFANGIGGTLFFGIDNDRNVIGLTDAQTDAETISRLIKERITSYPNFILAPEREDGKNILALSISAGRSTPYLLLQSRRYYGSLYPYWRRKCNCSVVCVESDSSQRDKPHL